MNDVGNSILGGDGVATLFLIGVLWWVGKKAAPCDSPSYACGCRLGLLAFVLCFGRAVFQAASSDPGDLAVLAVHGLFAAGLVMGAAWIILPILGFIHAATIGAFVRRFRKAWQGIGQYRAKRCSARQARRRDEQWVRDAPERAKATAQADEQARHSGLIAKRKEDARLRCETLYALHAKEIADRFPRELFDQFVAKYMGDKDPPEFVEERATALEQMIRQHAEKVEPSRKHSSLTELSEWYARGKQEAEAIDDERTRKTFLSRLKTRYVELSEKLLEDLT